MRPRQVLTLWVAGLSQSAIARELGGSANAVAGIIYRARQSGDPRAAARGTMPPHLKRNRAEMQRSRKATAVREIVLDGWAAGAIGKVIANETGLTHSAVRTVVCRARAANDARAVRRHAVGR